MHSARLSLRLLIVCQGLLAVVLLTGCGGKENTVIAPGEDYQLTEQERANKELEDRMRSGGSE
jgi:hypothetical protein